MREEYVPRVYRFALRLTGDPHLAEDLTQETVLRAWRHKSRLRDPNAARLWLFKIAANLWRDQIRQTSRNPEQADDGWQKRESTGPLPDRKLTEQEDVERAVAAIDRLPPRQREVLYLHACEGLSLAEITEILQISGEAAKASLSLARKKMRQQLKDICRDRFPMG